MKLKIVIATLFLHSFLLAKQPHITVVTAEWKPFSYMQNDSFVGIATDIMKAALDRAGYSYTIGQYPWARAYTMAQKDKNVLIYAIRRKTDREDLFKWICPILPARDMYVYKLKNRKDIMINSFSDIKKYRTTTIRQSIGHQLLLDKGCVDRENVFGTHSDENMFKLFFKGRVDLLISTDMSLMAHSSKNNDHVFHQVEKVLLLKKGKRSSSCMAFSLQTSDEIVNKVQNALNELVNEGIIEETVGRYMDFLSEKVH